MIIRIRNFFDISKDNLADLSFAAISFNFVRPYQDKPKVRSVCFHDAPF